MNQIFKAVAENRPFILEFEGRMPKAISPNPQPTLTSASFVVLSRTNGADATTTFFDSPNADISGTKLFGRLKAAGIVGARYKIMVTVNFSDGTILVEQILLDII